MCGEARRPSILPLCWTISAALDAYQPEPYHLPNPPDRFAAHLAGTRRELPGSTGQVRQSMAARPPFRNVADKEVAGWDGTSFAGRSSPSSP
jgi:hypothetical protein